MDDTRAVMDAVGCQRAALLGISEGGPLALLFAATYPERAAALILYGAFAHGWPGPRLREYLDAVDAGWGSAALYERLVPSRIDDLQLREAWAGYQRLAASPAMAAGLLRMADAIDVRPILPSVRTPTLVLHRPADPFVDIELGRELAAGLPHARYLEQPGPDHWPFFDGADELHRAVDDFLTAERAHLDVHRALLTLLVLRATGEDRVDPAEPAIAQELARWRGQRLRAGDHDTMLVAAFDGPARAIRCATALLRATRQGCVRAGLHTGECELAGDRVDGLALRVAAHTAATARPGEALATRTTHDVVAGSGLRLTARGSHAFPDTPGSWELYAVQ
jgi:hypothetical protein